MGFGTLFIGYFLLLNITYYSFTDLIAALVMAVGLTRLGSVNSHFKSASVAALVYALFGFAEFTLAVIDMISPTLIPPISFMPIVRSGLICALTVLILLGIRDVAREVDIPTLAARAGRMIPTAAAVYIATIILDTPKLFSGVAPIIAATIAMVVIIATLFLLVYNLITIYTAYMKICMPSELDRQEKPSRFGFVNTFRRHEAEKIAEYNECRREKSKNKGKKK